MLNIADTLHRWCREERPFALATVVDVTGSAPLPIGTSVAVDEDGNAVGSISGGCVEGAVYELCQQVLQEQGAPQRARFGYSDDDAFAVGLTCGGELDVLVQRVDPAAEPQLGAALTEAVEGRPAAVARVVVPMVLTGYGLGALLGTTLGGRLGDRRPLATLVTAAATTTLVLLLLTLLSPNPVAAVVLVTLMGMTGFAATPALGALALRFAGSAPTLASGLSGAAPNVGIAVGSWTEGIALTSPLGQAGPPLVGTVAAALTLVPLTALALIRATRSETPQPQPRAAAEQSIGCGTQAIG